MLNDKEKAKKEYLVCPICKVKVKLINIELPPKPKILLIETP